MADVNILRIQEAFRIDEVGRARTVLVVMWKVGVHGPFTFETGADTFDEETVRAELEKRAEKIARLFPGT